MEPSGRDGDVKLNIAGRLGLRFRLMSVVRFESFH